MSDVTEKTDIENTSTQNQDGAKVEMTQEQLNQLINTKYAKGAEKAKNELLAELGVDNVDSIKSLIEERKQQEEASKTELEKLQEQLQAEKEEKERLANSLTETQKKAKLTSLALQNGIDDVEYLEFKYSKASQQEGFDEAKFIDEFKTTSVVKQTPRVDSTSNKDNEPTDLATRVQGLTAKQLEQLANSI